MRVFVSKFAEKQLRRVPESIGRGFQHWVRAVELLGIREVRRYPGLHDEPLHGKRMGQRSVRLNRAYRAIYIETVQGLEILVIEVNKHGY